jgi:hypothetical protein
LEVKGQDFHFQNLMPLELAKQLRFSKSRNWYSELSHVSPTFQQFNFPSQLVDPVLLALQSIINFLRSNISTNLAK